MTPIPKGIPIREYMARAKARKAKRTEKRRQLVKAGQLTEMGWRYWRDKCDTVWAELVKAIGKRSNAGYCPTCDPYNKNTPSQACHKVPRTYYATRWLIENGYFGCSSCNLSENWHRGIKWDAIFIRAFGQAQMEHLKYVAAHGQSKFSVPELRAIYEALKSMLEGIRLIKS